MQIHAATLLPASLNAEAIRAGMSGASGLARGLPAAAYTDPAVLARELKDLFEVGWLAVALGQQLPNPGDVRPVSMAGHSLVLTRDRDGRLHAFHNVCRHRGFRLVAEAAQCRSHVVTCPYHCWSYKLDGALAATPYWRGTPASSPDPELRAQLGLLPVRMALWSDIVFVNLSGSAPPFEEFIRPLAERWREFDLDRLKLVDTKAYDIPANWKLVYENFLDLYHVPWVHPELGTPETAYVRENSVLSEDIFGYIMPQFYPPPDPTDAASAMPAFLQVPAGFERALDLVYVFPNTALILTPNWFQVFFVDPVAPGASREVLAGYAVDDDLSAPEQAPARAEFMGQLQHVNGQDIGALTRLQQGRLGPGSDLGCCVPGWDDLAMLLFRRVVRAY